MEVGMAGGREGGSEEEMEEQMDRIREGGNDKWMQGRVGEWGSGCLN